MMAKKLSIPEVLIIPYFIGSSAISFRILFIWVEEREEGRPVCGSSFNELNPPLLKRFTQFSIVVTVWPYFLADSEQECPNATNNFPCSR